MKRILVVSIVFLTSYLYAQEESNYGSWGNIGIGISAFNGYYESNTFNSEYGLTGRYGLLTATLKKTNQQILAFSFDNQNAKSTNILVGISDEISTSEKGLTKLCYLALAGVSFVNYEGYGNIKSFENINEKCTGLQIEGGLKLNLTKIVGITLTAHYNFNKIYKTIGGNINFIIGKL